ncbi:MAG: hypothetical protein ACPG5B_14285 [Chitinophagales bacterium]
MKKYLIICLLILCCSSIFAQKKTETNDKKKVGISLFSLDYSLQMPLFDLNKRFGVNSNIGLTFLQKTKGNFLFGADAHYLFGNSVKEDSLVINLSNSQGYIIGTDGFPAEIRFLQRGFSFSGKIGGIIPVSTHKPNSGIMVLLGAGYLQHKIRVDDMNDVVPQIQDEYNKGYDRLTAGVMLSQFVGYLYLDDKRRINFFAGLEFTQGFMQPQRLYYFDTQTMEKEQRFDGLVGLRVGWVLPIYREHIEQKYYTR